MKPAVDFGISDVARCYLGCGSRSILRLWTSSRVFSSGIFARRRSESAPTRQVGGSGRRIIRLAAKSFSAIGVLYDVREENVAFVEFSRHFRQHGLPVPEIYAVDLDQGAYLEEDLGDTTLFDFLSEARAGENIRTAVVEAYRQTLAFLPRFQVEAGRDLNYKVGYPRGRVSIDSPSPGT